MTEQENKPQITFEGETYAIEDISERARQVASHVEALQNDIAQQRFLLDRNETALGAFIAILRKELTSEDG